MTTTCVHATTTTYLVTRVVDVNGNFENGTVNCVREAAEILDDSGHLGRSLRFGTESSFPPMNE